MKCDVLVCTCFSDSSHDNSQSSTDTASFSGSTQGSCPPSAEKLKLEPVEILENGTFYSHVAWCLSHADQIVIAVAVWFSSFYTYHHIILKIC